MKYINCFLMSVIPGLLFGCTTNVESKKADVGATAQGQVYTLPRVEYSIFLEREIRSCTVDYVNDDERAIEWLREAAKYLSQMPMYDTEKINLIFNDEVLGRADILIYLDTILGKNWKAKYEPKEFEELNKLEMAFNSIPEKLKKLNAEISVKSQVTPTALPDIAYTYAINYSNMNNFIKATDYSIETYSNGTLKSVNVTLDDQTGEFIQQSIQGAAKIAALVGGFPLPVVTAQSATDSPFPSFEEWSEKQVSDETQQLCNADIRLKIRQRAALEQQIKGISESLIKLNKLAAKQETEISKLIQKRDATKKELDGILEETEAKKKLEAELKKTASNLKQSQLDSKTTKAELDESTETLEKFNEKVSKIKGSLTIKTTNIFNPKLGATNATSVFQVELEDIKDKLDAWLDLQKVKKYCGENCIDGLPKELLKKLNVYAAIYPGPAKAGTATQESAEGIVYRQPIKSKLYICKENKCINENNQLTIENKNIVASSFTDVPQFGVLAVLPLKNKPFQNNNIAASFSELGYLTKLEYKSNAAGVKAAEAFSASASTLLQYNDAKRNEDTSKLNTALLEVQAKTKLLEAQLKQEKAQTELDDFKQNNSKTDSN